MNTDDLIFSNHLNERMEQRNLKNEWILDAIRMPEKTDKIADNEIHFYKVSAVFFDQCLKVVVNPTAKIIVTAHFDRNKTKKGLK